MTEQRKHPLTQEKLAELMKWHEELTQQLADDKDTLERLTMEKTGIELILQARRPKGAKLNCQRCKLGREDGTAPDYCSQCKDAIAAHERRLNTKGEEATEAQAAGTQAGT